MEEQFVPSVLIANIALMSMLGVITIAIIRMTSLFGIVMLSGVYSLRRSMRRGATVCVEMQVLSMT